MQRLKNSQRNQWNDLLEWEILRGTKTAFFVPNVIPLYPIHVIIKKGDYCAEEITKDVSEWNVEDVVSVYYLMTLWWEQDIQYIT